MRTAQQARACGFADIFVSATDRGRAFYVDN
jgi:hypothetical protein